MLEGVGAATKCRWQAVRGGRGGAVPLGKHMLQTRQGPPSITSHPFLSLTHQPFPPLCVLQLCFLPDKFSLLNLTSFQPLCWANYIKMDVAGTLYGLFIVILFVSHAYK